MCEYVCKSVFVFSKLYSYDLFPKGIETDVGVKNTFYMVFTVLAPKTRL